MDSWFYEKLLDLLDFMPEDNHFLDIWQLEVRMNHAWDSSEVTIEQGNPEPVIQEGELDSESLDQYLAKVSRQTRLGLYQEN